MVNAKITAISGRNDRRSHRYERMPYKIDRVRPHGEYQAALEAFHPVNPAELPRQSGEIPLYTDPIVEEYFHAVGLAGVSFIKWEIVQPVFLWKLEVVIDYMAQIELETKPEVVMNSRLTDAELKELREFIMTCARSWMNAPFTFQRICELLALPTVNYRIAEKFYRALEKNVNVVSEVTPEGKRITGVEDNMAAFDDDGASSCCETDEMIEKHFLVCVDEVDRSIADQKSILDAHLEPVPSAMTRVQHFRLSNAAAAAAGDRPETPSPSDDDRGNLEDFFAVIDRSRSPLSTPPVARDTVDMFASPNDDEMSRTTPYSGSASSPSSSLEVGASASSPSAGVFLSPKSPRSPRSPRSSV